MANANPTLFGNNKKKLRYIEDGGEKYTFVRCDKCDTKFVKENSDGICPECLGKGKKPVQKS